MDDMSPEQRHNNMTRIRSKNTKPETIVRHFLFSAGFRYRKNDARYPGKPDIVLPKYHTVIFVHGCFWHQHANCKYSVLPKTNQEYWIPKLEKNTTRDSNTVDLLKVAGWRVIVVWECAIKAKNRQDYLAQLLEAITHSSESFIEIAP